MHLLIPSAAPPDEAIWRALQTLQLPQLQALLARLSVSERDDADASSLSPPHERALARLYGWQVHDGLLPWAAHLAAQAGHAPDDAAWGLLSLVHLQVGADQVRLLDPAQLALDDAASRTLFDAMHGLFASEGGTLVRLDALRWLLAHPALQELPTASLDRVIGQGIDAWLPSTDRSRLLRRLQNEAQMLLYGHPVNEQRAAQGLPAVNSFWISGCGAAQPATVPDALQIDRRLQAPAWDADWGAWADAWRALDAGPVAALRAASIDAPATITLCGARAAVTLSRQPRSLWQRVAQRRPAVSATALLETL